MIVKKEEYLRLKYRIEELENILASMTEND